MKWSWKSFSIQVPILIAAGLLLTWNINLLLNSIEVLRAPPRDYTFWSCFLGSLPTSLIFASVGAWRHWSLGQVLAAVLTASTVLCFGIIPAGILITLAAAVFYMATAKILLTCAWYLPSKMADATA